MFGALVKESLGTGKQNEEKLSSVTPTEKKDGEEDKKGSWLDSYYTEEEKVEEEQMSPEEKQRKELKETSAYKKLANNQMHTITEEEMRNLFTVLDLNKDGTLERHEIMSAFRNCQSERNEDLELNSVLELLEQILNTTDVDDKAIDCEDMRQALRLGCESHARDMTLKLQGHDPAKGEWIWRDKLVEYLKRRKETNENCKSLPVTLFFFILFFYLASSHLKVKELNMINSSIKGTLNVKTDKLANGFPETARSLVHQRLRAPDIASYNKVLGGFRVSKILPMPSMAPQGPLCTYLIGDFINERMDGNVGVMDPKVCQPGWGNQSNWMLWALKSEEAFSFLAGIDGRDSWPDYASKPNVEGVNVDAVTYNEKLGLYTLIHYEVNILPSGYVKVKEKVESIVAHPAWLTISEDLKDGDKRTVMFIGIIFIVMFVLVAMGETAEYIGLICSYGPIRGTKEYIDFWNLIDWMNIFMVAIIMMVYFYCVHLTSGLNHLVSNIEQLDPGIEYTLSGMEYALGTTAAEYTGRLNQIVQQGEVLIAAYFDLKWYISVFSICSALRFFKAFRANPRLNCVTQTLVRSFPDLAHFMLVFLSLLMAFVLIGHLLFGSRIADFSTPGKALNTCFLFLLCYAFDPLAPEMYEHGGTLGLLWAWSFNIGMVLLLLNMVLAIVFDVYAEVKSGAGDAPSLIKQGMDVVQELQERGGKRKAMLDAVQDQVLKVGEAVYDKSGVDAKILEAPMDGSWMRPDEGLPCATIYGTDLVWMSGEMVKLELNSKGTEAAFTNALGTIVTFKLDRQDPERPILIFAGGDIWEKAPDTAITEIAKKKKPKSLKQKADWTENDLLNALDAHNAHQSEIVSAPSLAKEFAATLIQEKQLAGIIESALASSSEDASNQEVSLSDSIRLVCRIDTNVRSAVRLNQMPKDDMNPDEEKDIIDAEERMKQVEMALGTINAQLDRILSGKKKAAAVPMQM